MRQEFRITRTHYGLGYELRFADFSDGERIALAGPVTITMYERSKLGYESPPPMMNINEGAMQSLMDELWNVGIRPKDIGTAGHLAATQAHLGDMRKLVEKTLDVKL